MPSTIVKVAGVLSYVICLHNEMLHTELESRQRDGLLWATGKLGVFPARIMASR